MADQEFFVRDTRLPGHFWADNEVLDIFGPLLGAYGIAVYMTMCRTAINGTGECRISRRRIAKQLDIAVGSAHNALELIVKLSLAKLVQEGTPRTPAIYVLADVKSLCDPKMLQMRLGSSVHQVNAEARLSVHTVNAAPKSVHQVNPSDHGVNAKSHQVNAGFTTRTRNKEVKTLSRLKTDKTGGSVCLKCQNRGTIPQRAHPGEEIYCGCSIGQALQRAEVHA
jgi:hypothetical protein